jgi:hypothetical protein
MVEVTEFGCGMVQPWECPLCGFASGCKREAPSRIGGAVMCMSCHELLIYTTDKRLRTATVPETFALELRFGEQIAGWKRILVDMAARQGGLR